MQVFGILLHVGECSSSLRYIHEGIVTFLTGVAGCGEAELFRGVARRGVCEEQAGCGGMGIGPLDFLLGEPLICSTAISSGCWEWNLQRRSETYQCGVPQSVAHIPVKCRVARAVNYDSVGTKTKVFCCALLFK